MNFKFKSIMFFLAIATIAGLSSCEKDDVTIAPPEITDLEVGLRNSLVGYIGRDLHMEAEVLAEGLIDKITVEIHKEDGSSDEIEAEFTDYAGYKNTTFHKHIDIPFGTEAGEYHFHLTVIDQEGNSTSVETDISIEE